MPERHPLRVAAGTAEDGKQLVWDGAIGGLAGQDPDRLLARERFGVGTEDAVANAQIMREKVIPEQVRTGLPIKITGEVAFDGALSPDLTTPPRIVGDDPATTTLWYENESTPLSQLQGSYDYLGGTVSTGEGGGIGLARLHPRRSQVLEFDQPHGLDAADVADEVLLDLRDFGQVRMSLWRANTPLGYAGETIRVARVVDSTRVELRRGLQDALTSRTRVRRIVPVKAPMLKNLSIRVQDPGAQQGGARAFNWRRTYGARIENVQAYNYANAIFSLPETIGAKLHRVYGDNGRNDLGGGPYLIRVGEGADDIEITGLSGRYTRHFITGTSDPNYHLPIWVVIRDAYLQEASSAALSSHWAADMWFWISCIVRGSGSPYDDVADGFPSANDSGQAGFQARALRQFYRDCEAWDLATGLTVPGGNQVRWKGGVIGRCRTGMWVSASSDVVIHGDVEFRDCVDRFIVVDDTGGAADEAPTGTPKPVNLKMAEIDFHGDTNETGVQFQSWDASFQIDMPTLRFLGPQTLLLRDTEGQPALRVTAKRENALSMSVQVTADDLVLYASGVEVERVEHAGVPIEDLATGLNELSERLRAEALRDEAPLAVAALQPMHVGHHDPVSGYQPPTLAAEETLVIPEWTDAYRLAGDGPVETVQARASDTGRSARLLAVNGMELPGFVTDDPHVLPQTMLRVSCDGTGWYIDSRQSRTIAPPLDAITTEARRVYSLRLERTDYAGAAVRVRRSTDGAELDIAFTDAGGLDVDALLAFAGSASVTIKTWYDQSGNVLGLNLTQATVANQATIVTAGVLETVAGIPAAKFDGVNDYYADTSPGFYAAANGTVIAVMAAPMAGTQVLLSEYSTASNTPKYDLLANTTQGKSQSLLANDAAATPMNFAGHHGPVVWDGTMHVVSVVDTGSQWTVRGDGGTAGVRNYTRADPTTLNAFMLGGEGRTSAGRFYFAGHLAALRTFTVPLDAVERQAIEHNDRQFYGTP